MSENLRKLNQESSLVGLNELGQLSQVTAIQSTSAREKKKLEGRAVHFLAVMPDYSAEASEAAFSGTGYPNSVESQLASPTVSADEYFRMSSADDMSDANRSMSFDLRPKLDDNTALRSNYRLHELKTAETGSERSQLNRSEEKLNPAAGVGSVERPAALLAAAVGTYLIDPDASFINRLIQRQEKLGAQVILFADVDGAARCSSTCVQVGIELSTKTGKRVLVVDSDTTARSLSSIVLAGQVNGLTDLVRGDVEFERTAQGTEKQDIEFLSAGVKPFDFVQSNDLTRENAEKLVGKVRNQYDFICISLGTAFDSSLRMWGQNCDMTFLTIDPICTSRSLAKAAVAELHKFGARVEGCITTLFEKN